MSGKSQFLEGGGSNKHSDPASKVVNSSCSTPSNYAIANDILRIHDVDSTMRTQRPPPGINPHPYDSSARSIPHTSPELGVFSLQQQPHTQPIPLMPTSAPFLPSYFHTTLNPFAPPIYLQSPQTMNTTPHSSVHVPTSQPTIPPFYHNVPL